MAAPGSAEVGCGALMVGPRARERWSPIRAKLCRRCTCSTVHDATVAAEARPDGGLRISVGQRFAERLSGQAPSTPAGSELLVCLGGRDPTPRLVHTLGERAVDH